MVLPIYAIEDIEFPLIGYGDANIDVMKKCDHTEVIEMAMEPISGIVSFQAQNYQTETADTKVPTPAGKTAEEFVVVPKDATQPVDKTTVSVVAADTVNIYKDGGGKKAPQELREKKKRQQEAVEEKTEEALEKEHEKIREVMEELNKKLTNSEALFGIHEETNRVTIKIVDKTTKEVIKEFPPEKNLDLLAKTWELAGIMVDQKG